MNIVTTYIAYDGTSFDDRKECLEYENYARDMLTQILERCVFYTDCTEMIYPYFHNLNEMIKWVEIRWKYVDKITVKEELPMSAFCWWLNYFGYCLPDVEGTWIYNWRVMGWDRSE